MSASIRTALQRLVVVAIVAASTRDLVAQSQLEARARWERLCTIRREKFDRILPEAMREKWGYPELSEAAKRKIFGLTSAKLYGIKTLDTGSYKPVPKDYESKMTDKLKTLLEFGQLRADNMSKMKETYVALAIQPDHTRYGWMRSA